jgi:ABC-2 type transport system permease protein
MFFLIKYLLRLWRRRDAARDATGEPDRSTPVASAAIGPTGPSAAARGTLALLAHQVRFDTLASIRNPRARFFTFFFPILLLVIFTGVFGHGTTVVDGTRVRMAQFYVPGILAMSIITSTYGGLVMTIASARATGVLKRRRATPVPAAILVGGQAIATLLIAVCMSAVLLVIARVGYGVGISVGGLAATACAVAVGTFAFACLGYAVAGLIGSPDAAQPIIQVTTMPLYFISGVWIPNHNLPDALRTVASIFPVEHLAAATHLASVRGSFSSALAPGDLAVLAVWAIAAGIFAARRFSWLPHAVNA